MEFQKRDNENFLDYAERLITNREFYDLDKVEIYELLYGNQVSSDHARKALTTLQMTIEEQKKSNVNTEISNSKEMPKSYKETIELNKDGTQTSDKLILMSNEQCKDVEFLLKSHGYCIKTWELVNAKNNIWNVYSKQDGIQVLYSSKITVKPRINSISMQEIKEHFEQFNINYQSPVHIPTKYDVNGKMLELNIADLHLGKLAWVGDAGESYDYKIAKERFFYIINDVLTRTSHYKFNKILFIWSNDFFHYDSTNITTTAGTRQDSDLRWQKLYKVGIEMLIEAIDLLSQHAPVETFYIGSNHDKMTSFYAINELYAWFRHNENIKINIEAQARKYVEFGNSLIGFTHGDSEKKNRIGKLMPIEAREAWGRTLYHEVHAAHFHSEQVVKEENGIIVRYISSPTSTDNWHYENGYVGAVKKAQSFIWDKECGLTDIIHTVIK